MKKRGPGAVLSLYADQSVAGVSLVSFPCSFLLVDNITAAFSLSLSCRGADGLGPRFSPLRKARILLSPPRRGAQNLATYRCRVGRSLWLPSGARFLRLVLATPRDRCARTAFAPITQRRTRRLPDCAPRSTRATRPAPFSAFLPRASRRRTPS